MDEQILEASRREVDELDDALVSDDTWHRNGSGEVLWLDSQCSDLWRHT